PWERCRSEGAAARRDRRQKSWRGQFSLHAPLPPGIQQTIQHVQLGIAPDADIQVSEKPGGIAQIARLAVAVANAGKDADHFKKAVGADEITAALPKLCAGGHRQPGGCGALAVILQPAVALFSRPA